MMIPNWIASNVDNARQTLKLITLDATLSACGLQGYNELPIEVLQNENLIFIDPFKSHGLKCQFYREVIKFVVLGM